MQEALVHVADIQAMAQPITMTSVAHAVVRGILTILGMKPHVEGTHVRAEQFITNAIVVLPQQPGHMEQPHPIIQKHVVQLSILLHGLHIAVPVERISGLDIIIFVVLFVEL